MTSSRKVNVRINKDTLYNVNTKALAVAHDTTSTSTNCASAKAKPNNNAIDKNNDIASAKSDASVKAACENNDTVRANAQYIDDYNANCRADTESNT